MAVVTAIVAAAATPVFARLARRSGLVAEPRQDRWHARTTPLLGGAAITLAALVVLAATSAPTEATFTVLGGGLLAFALGLVDDIRHLAPTTKLVGQALIGAVLAFGGIQVEIVAFAPLAFVLTILWVVLLMNAFNLLDNMDGLAAGVAAIAGAALGLTALPERPQVALVAGVVAGSALGFLPHNISPARIFMGDAGSLFLGYLLAALALLHTASGATNLGLAVVGPLAVLALPIFDTALVATLRRLAGRPVAQGGRDHASHRLAAIGLSDRAAVVLLWSVAAVLAAVGIVADLISALVVPLIVLVAVGLVLFGAFLAEIDVYGRRAGDDGTRRDPVRQAIRVYGRFGAEVAMDVALLTTAYYLAYLARFESRPSAEWLSLFTISLPIVVGLQLVGLVVTGVYRALWRYLTIHDIVGILRATALGAAAAAVALVLIYRFEGYSRAVFLLDVLLSAALVVGSRVFLVWLRSWAAGRPQDGDRRVLIVGATDGGVLALRLLARAPGTRHRAIGFLDDDPGKRYRRVAGIPVVGTVRQLEEVVPRLKIDLVVLATEDGRDQSPLRASCERLGIEVREFAVTV